LREGARELLLARCREIVERQAQALRGLLGIAKFDVLSGMFGIGNNGDPSQLRDDVPQDFEALAVEVRRHERKPGHVSSRTRKAIG
jgi:hypothetical protein